MGRGLQRAPIESIRTAVKGVYRRSPKQNVTRNQKRVINRLRKKNATLKKDNKKLLKMNEMFVRVGLENMSPRYISKATQLIVKEVLKQKQGSCWSPVSVAVAQFEQESHTLSLAGVEILRKIEPAEKYGRRLIPSRAAIQRFKKNVAVAGEEMTKPQFSPEGDIVYLDAKSIIEEVITESKWPGLDPSTIAPSEFSPEVLKEKVAALKPLRVVATADGARLTASRGMVIQGIKFVSQDIVNKLVPNLDLAPSSTGSTVPYVYSYQKRRIMR